MMSIRSLADFNRSSLGGDGDWLTPPPSPLRPDKPGRHDERGMGTSNWPPARTSTWPYTGTFSWPRTDKEFNDSLTTFSATNCSGDESQVGNDPSKFPVCIITYKTPFTSQAAMDAFLQTVPASHNQQIILVWYQEPEGKTFRSEEHTSELQSRPHLVCRLL